MAFNSPRALKTNRRASRWLAALCAVSCFGLASGRALGRGAFDEPEDDHLIGKQADDPKPEVKARPSKEKREKKVEPAAPVASKAPQRADTAKKPTAAAEPAKAPVAPVQAKRAVAGDPSDPAPSSVKPPVAEPAKPRVLVLPYASVYKVLPSQIGVKTAEFLTAELRASKELQVVALDTAPETLTSNPTPARDESLLNRARQSMAEGQDALENGDFQKAISSLNKAKELLRLQHPYISFRELNALYIDLAIASYQLGEEIDGRTFLRLAAQLHADQALDTAKLPPVFIRAFESAAREIKDAPKGRLQIDASPAGSTVYLDGHKMGETPLVIEDVVPGTRYLRIVPKEAATIWAEPVEVVAKTTLRRAPKIDLVGGALSELDGLLSENALDARAVQLALSLGRQAGATHVALGTTHQEKGGIAVTSYLLSTETSDLCPLERTLFDHGMIGASIELYKVGADLGAKLPGCASTVGLPALAAADAPQRATQVPSVRPEALTAFQQFVHVPAERRGSASEVARLSDLSPASAQLSDAGALAGNARQPQAAVKEEKRNLTWLWITLGVVGAAGLATGGHFIAKANMPPDVHVQWAK